MDTNELPEQAAKYGQKAVEAIDSRRGAAASGIENAASNLRKRASDLPGGDTVSGYARQTADKLSQTADYIRDHEVKDMAGELQGYVKAHPTQAILGAAIVGFLAGRALRS